MKTPENRLAPLATAVMLSLTPALAMAQEAAPAGDTLEHVEVTGKYTVQNESIRPQVWA